METRISIELTPGVLTDISPYVRPLSTTFALQEGLEVEESSAGSGRSLMRLDNSGHQFTTGQSMAIRQSMRVVVEQVVDGHSFTLLDGFTLAPEVDDWTEADGANSLLVPVVDRIGREESAPALDSLLTEHIPLVGGDRLVGYWVCGESVAPVGRSSIAEMPDLARTTNLPQGAPGVDLLAPGGGEPAPGDEVMPALWTVAGSGLLSFASLGCVLPSTITVDSAHTLQLVTWLRLGEIPGGGEIILSVSSEDGNVSASLTRFEAGSTLSGFHSSAFVASTSAYMYQRNPVRLTGRPIMAMITLTGGAWPVVRVNNSVLSSYDTSGSPPSSWVVDRLTLGGIMAGSLWHAQLYSTTAAAAFSDAEFRAQYEVGQRGHAGQTVVERMTTIAELAGLDPGLLDVDDDCSARMQILRTQGRRPIELWRDVAETEQGLLHADGRVLRLRSRRDRYRPNEL